MDQHVVRLEELLDRVSALKEAGDLGPQRDLACAKPADPAAGAVLRLMGDPQMRPEHRQRIYGDLARHRDLLIQRRDARLVDLVFWSEHVERLYKGVRGGALQTFHYVRALEATCRRSGFDLLPALGRMEDLGEAWSQGAYEKTLQLLAPRMPEADEGPARAEASN